MPLDGNGTYTPPTPEYPVIADTYILASDFNAIIADLSAALSTALYRDGQTPFTANFPAGGFKITGLGAGSAATDAVNYGQVFGGTLATTVYVDATAFNSALPLQTGNAGKIVTTDGTNASWAASPVTELAIGVSVAGGTTVKTLEVDDNLVTSQAARRDAANTFTAAQVFSDQSVSRAILKDCGYAVVDKGNISNATVTFDYTAGSVQTYTATGSTVTWAFSNWPPTGNLGELLIIGTNMGAFTHSISGLTWTLLDGTTTTSVATFLAQNGYRTAFRASGVDKILLVTRDAGTTVYASLIGL